MSRWPEIRPNGARVKLRTKWCQHWFISYDKGATWMRVAEEDNLLALSMSFSDPNHDVIPEARLMWP